MPDKSQAQRNLMAGILHGWRPTGMKNPPSKQVAREFISADKSAGKFQGKSGK